MVTERTGAPGWSRTSAEARATPAQALPLGARAEAPRWTVWASILLVAAIAATAVLVARRSFVQAATNLADGELVRPYQATLYWLDYREGFVRRGLPGSLLTLGQEGPPSYPAMTATGIAVSVAAAVALVVLGVLLARAASSRLAAVATVALFLASPFTLPLVVRDIGRFDAGGVVALVAVALLPRWRPASPLMLVLVSTAVVVACASQEFLIAYLLPLGLIAAWRHAGARAERGAPPRPWLAAVAVLAPGAAVTVASLLATPTEQLVDDTVLAARRAGVGEGEPAGNYAVTVIDATLSEQLALFDSFPSAALIMAPAVLSGLYLALSYLLWTLTGRPAPRLLAATALYLTGAALVMGLMGIDFRRWWAFSFVAFAGVLCAHVTVRRAGTGAMGWPLQLLAAAALGACVLVQELPLGPFTVDLPVLHGGTELVDVVDSWAEICSGGGCR